MAACRPMWIPGLNFVPVEDCAAGHLLAAERGRIGERYILGGENLTLKQMLDMLLAGVSGRPAPRVRDCRMLLAYGGGLRGYGGLAFAGPRAADSARRRAHGAAQHVCRMRESARRELGFAPGPVAAAWSARYAGTKRTATSRGQRAAGIAAGARGLTYWRHIAPGSRSGRMKILVTFAVASGIRGVAAAARLSLVTREPFPLYAADIGGSTVRVLLTGIGAGLRRRALCAGRWPRRRTCASPAVLRARCVHRCHVGDILAARVVRRAEQGAGGGQRSRTAVGGNG